MKKLSRIFCLLLALVTLLGAFSACDTGNQPGTDNGDQGTGGNGGQAQNAVQTVYAEAQKLGYEGSLEEFLALCKGKDGVGIVNLVIDVEGNLIVYYTDAPRTPVNLGKVLGLKGETGPQGPQGEQGEKGEDGITPQLRINAATNEWEISADGGKTWTPTGVKATGAPGKDGADGEDGKDGADGEDGKDGENGKDGVTPLIRIHETTNFWEVSVDGGKTWQSTAVKATGAAGAPGAQGPQGDTGATIKKVEFDAQGRLVITLTDGTVLPPVELPKEEEHQHTFGDWIVVVPGTCTTKGLQMRVCGCGDSEAAESPIQHTPEWLVVLSPTWTASGLREYRCTQAGCNKVLDSEVIEAKTPETALPDTLDYGGEEVVLMYWSDVERPEFEQKEITGDNVRDAIYDRNVLIEDKLNIDLEFVGVPAAYNGAREPFLKQIDAIYATGTQDYDIIATYARTEGTLAVQGYLQNLATIQDSYIDPSSPWWPQRMIENVSIGDGYYFLSGDMSTNALYMMHCMFINKDMFSQFQIELPYQTVRDGKWTIDKLLEVTSDRYRDLDNDNLASANDRYGFCALNYVVESLYTSSNLRYVEQSVTDMLVLSPDYSSKKAVQLIDKLGQWATTDSVWITSGSQSTAEEQRATWSLFKTGRTLIHMAHACYAEIYLSNVDFEYGLVPTPKYDEKQVNYYTGVGNPISLYGIFVDFDDRGDRQQTLTMFSAVLECWGAYGYSLTTPEIFEVTMQLKYDDGGQDETDMFNYVRAGITFDLGKIFALDLNNVCELPSYAIAGGANWALMVRDYRRSVEVKLEAVVENFRTYQASRDQQ